MFCYWFSLVCEADRHTCIYISCGIPLGIFASHSLAFPFFYSFYVTPLFFLPPPACYIDAIHHDTKNHPGDAFTRTFNTIRKNRSRDFLFPPWVPFSFQQYQHLVTWTLLYVNIRYTTPTSIPNPPRLSRNIINKRVVHTIHTIHTLHPSCKPACPLRHYQRNQKRSMRRSMMMMPGRWSERQGLCMCSASCGRRRRRGVRSRSCGLMRLVCDFSFFFLKGLRGGGCWGKDGGVPLLES